MVVALKVEICRLGPDEIRKWDNYVESSSRASYCHLSGWKRVIELSYGHKAYYLWAVEDGKVTGILPAIFMRTVCFGRKLVSLPYLDYGGMCVDDTERASQLYEAALRISQSLRTDVFELRHSYVSPIDLPTYGSKVSMVLELRPVSDSMWEKLDPKVRNQIRKAKKCGLDAHWGGREGLKQFYEIFAANMRDLGSPVHSYKFFQAVLDEFSILP